MTEQILVFTLGAGFVLVHLLASRMDWLDRTPRSLWLSTAGGVSIAYVFVHLLPELGHFSRDTELHAGLYVAALAGFVGFYGIEAHIRRTSDDDAAFRLHLTSYAGYNVVVGYLLDAQAREEPLAGLLFYAFALSLHLIINDRALAERHGARHAGGGRLTLAGSVATGVLVGAFVELPEAAVAVFFALLAGATVLTVIKEELPKQRQSRFGAFAGGALLYSVLLLLGF
ncbi:hypothetical protein [Citreimonas salinaria]|uniref:ZIP Zinc transporter n=1 Tax=Citreimonas salinaria TaxID=321339 RepID=A0A1H3J778_9RHOB|nr:hypothetical protein [Citreimonas salinaria]SDY35044.1 hypothetical protein SAMN05444340_10660 [Citreimonas salinaria]